MFNKSRGFTFICMYIWQKYQIILKSKVLFPLEIKNLYSLCSIFVRIKFLGWKNLQKIKNKDYLTFYKNIVN